MERDALAWCYTAGADFKAGATANTVGGELQSESTRGVLYGGSIAESARGIVVVVVELVKHRSTGAHTVIYGQSIGYVNVQIGDLHRDWAAAPLMQHSR